MPCAMVTSKRAIFLEISLIATSNEVFKWRFEAILNRETKDVTTWGNNEVGTWAEKVIQKGVNERLEME